MNQREIKFRYRIQQEYKDKKMILTRIYTLQDIEKGIMKLEKEEKILSKDQFIGLKDKNGVEIFEGDVVKFDYNTTPIEKRKGIVEWNERDCAWNFDKLLMEPTPQKTIEVIGNIYSNPELLK